MRVLDGCSAHTHFSLDDSQQMEGFFMSIAQDPEMPGYEVFEKEAWGFKVSGAMASSGLRLKQYSSA